MHITVLSCQPKLLLRLIKYYLMTHSFSLKSVSTLLKTYQEIPKLGMLTNSFDSISHSSATASL